MRKHQNIKPLSEDLHTNSFTFLHIAKLEPLNLSYAKKGMITYVHFILFLSLICIVIHWF